MIVVLDTVVYVRALINPKGRWGQIVFEIAGRYGVAVSPEIIREVIDVLSRPELKAKLPTIEYLPRFETILGVLQQAEVFEPEDGEPVCRDPDDDMFFWCADEASADYIISGDKDVLAVSSFRGIRTVSAVEFTIILEEQAG